VCSFRAKCIHCDRALTPSSARLGAPPQAGRHFCLWGWGSLSLPARGGCLLGDFLTPLALGAAFPDALHLDRASCGVSQIDLSTSRHCDERDDRNAEQACLMWHRILISRQPLSEYTRVARANAIDAYEAVRWPHGKASGGKG
jgi:hypothetical protein